MTRNIFCFVLACLLFAFASADAGEQIETRNWRLAPDVPSFNRGVGPVDVPVLHRGIAGTQIATTFYDYMWNSGSPTRIVYHNGWSYMGFVGRTAAGPQPREFTYVSYDGTTFLAPTPGVAGSISDTYFSGLDVFRGGAVDGIAGLASGYAPGPEPNVSYWCVEATPGAGDFATFVVTDEDRDTQPLILDPATGEILIYDTEGRTDYSFNQSTDFGVTWTEINDGILAQGSAPGDQAQGILDVSLLLAPNGNVIVGTTLTGLGNATPGSGIDLDSADVWGYFVSTDKGLNFTWNQIAYDGEETLPGYFGIPDNFSQADFAVDGSNMVHSVANGYAIRANPDTSAGTIGVTYWNETVGFKEIAAGPTTFDKEWPIIDTLVLALYPGNALGCAYPTIAVSDDGMFVLAVWSQPGFTESTVDTLDGFMLLDLYYNYSADGGATWGNAMQLTSTPDRSEVFATLAELEVVSGTSSPGSATYKARVLYLEDTNNGASPFGEGPEAAEPIVYHEWEITPVTSVEPIDGTVPETYGLAQNYPNPFNPTTNINYSIPTAGFVTLKVYDVLGQEVATLVNQEQVAGSYRVDFNAVDLANGAYFYRLTAGTFTDVKKMVLMK